MFAPYFLGGVPHREARERFSFSSARTLSRSHGGIEPTEQGSQVWMEDASPARPSILRGLEAPGRGPGPRFALRSGRGPPAPPPSEALIAQRAGGKALPTEVVQHIVTKTDGVPRYVEELTKMLLASPLLRAGTQYVLTEPLRTVAIPDTLQGALMARLDQLPAAKAVAQLAAVVGREVTYELVKSIAPQACRPCKRGWGSW